MAIVKPLILFCSFLFSGYYSVAQKNDVPTNIENQGSQFLTITYNIEIKSSKSDNNIAETYNGGVRTVFMSDKQARVRLASLMRMQSIFILPAADPRGAAVIVKESGKTKYKSYLTQTEWQTYNAKYDKATCVTTNETLWVAGYNCKKVIVKLTDGKEIEAYYTDSLHGKFFQLAEPAFRCVPGVVLRYTYAQKKGRMIFTASNISSDPISAEVFSIPEKGYATRKFADSE